MAYGELAALLLFQEHKVTVRHAPGGPNIGHALAVFALLLLLLWLAVTHVVLHAVLGELLATWLTSI
jgi:hypothetical protein